MSAAKFNNGSKDGLSLQMALLHLRWQQIRQLELQEAAFNEEEESTPSFLNAGLRGEEAYTTA